MRLGNIQNRKIRQIPSSAIPESLSTSLSTFPHSYHPGLPHLRPHKSSLKLAPFKTLRILLSTFLSQLSSILIHVPGKNLSIITFAQSFHVARSAQFTFSVVGHSLTFFPLHTLYTMPHGSRFENTLTKCRQLSSFTFRSRC